mmetsp:Transcript_1052/g.1534  ORF Transcript_1052/g.1534 Transcript_1052/m.1534 type:complete len:507 (+) Transcript_1052:259-1779(+)
MPSPTTSPTFALGQLVDVASRTWAGINRPGGVGRIIEVHSTSDNITHVDVKYILGGCDKQVEVCFVKTQVESESGGRGKRRRRNVVEPVVSCTPPKKRATGKNKGEVTTPPRPASPESDSSADSPPSEPLKNRPVTTQPVKRGRSPATKTPTARKGRGGGKRKQYVVVPTVSLSPPSSSANQKVVYDVEEEIQRIDKNLAEPVPEVKRVLPAKQVAKSRATKQRRVSVSPPPTKEKVTALKTKKVIPKEKTATPSTKTHVAPPVKFNSLAFVKAKQEEECRKREAAHQNMMRRKLTAPRIMIHDDTKKPKQTLSTKTVKTDNKPISIALDPPSSSNNKAAIITNTDNKKTPLRVVFEQNSNAAAAFVGDIVGVKKKTVHKIIPKDRTEEEKKEEKKEENGKKKDGLDVKLDERRNTLFVSFLNQIMMKKQIDEMQIDDILSKSNGLLRSDQNKEKNDNTPLFSINPVEEDEKAKYFTELEIRSYLKRLHDNDRIMVTWDTGTVYRI